MRSQILIVVNTSHCLFGTQRMGDTACVHVLALVRCYSHKQVCRFCASIFQDFNTRWRPLNGHNIVLRIKSCQPRRVWVYQHTILMIARKQFRQVSSNGTCTGYHNLHDSMAFLILAASSPTICCNSSTVPCSTNFVSGIPRRVTRGA